jgi:hypothetical protein
MLIGPSQSLLQALGSSVAPPESVRLAPTPRAAPAALPPKPVTPTHASHQAGDVQPKSAAPREPEAAPRDRDPQRGSKLDILV